MKINKRNNRNSTSQLRLIICDQIWLFRLLLLKVFFSPLVFVVTRPNIKHHSLRSSVRCVHETVSRVVVQTSFPLSLQCHVTHKQLNQSQSRNLCHHYNYSHFFFTFHKEYLLYFYVSFLKSFYSHIRLSICH